jgi:hypothetical protein
MKADKHAAAVAAARKVFERYGYEVRVNGHKNANGPDLVLIGKSDVWRVEVLTTRRLASGSYRTCNVQPARLNDDFVFILFAKDAYVTLPMHIYKAAMAEDGSLTMTDWVRLVGSL